MLYGFVLGVHLIAVISWFAGLFYLPRLFVYHAENKNKKSCTTMLEVMEKRLLHMIMAPAMVATWGAGVTLVMLNPSVAQGGWFHVKTLLVLGLTAYHLSLVWFRRQFAQGRNCKSSRFFRMYNEIPTLLLIVIVFLVVLKPF